MYKDYMSLEMASFIIRLRVLAPKNCFITPSLWQTGPAEARRQLLERKGGKKRKIFHKDDMEIQRANDCISIHISFEVKHILEIV